MDKKCVCGAEVVWREDNENLIFECGSKRVDGLIQCSKKCLKIQLQQKDFDYKLQSDWVKDAKEALESKDKRLAKVTQERDEAKEEANTFYNDYSAIIKEQDAEIKRLNKVILNKNNYYNKMLFRECS